MSILARWFLKTGAMLIVLGAALTALKRIRLPGRLPGDISWKIGSSRMVVPLGTTTLIGLLLTAYFNVSRRHT